MHSIQSPDDDHVDGRFILSFCIPTLNRTKELCVSLESIVSQAVKGVEIVIIDGGAIDETHKIVNLFRERLPEIRVYESETKSGVDRDILQSVALARGRYCWLFSDDDFLVAGALEKVLSVIKSNTEIIGISTNYAAYDSNLEYTIATSPAIGGRRAFGNLIFDTREECFSRLGIHLGFISCQIIDRAIWVRVAQSEDLSHQCNAWIIVYVIGKMLEMHPKWFYLHDVCVGYRSGNDSFIERLGVLKRQEITHLHYAQTIGSLFPCGSKVYRNVFKILLKDRMPRTLAVLKSKGLSISVQFTIFKMYFFKYWSYLTFWVRVVPIFFVPNRVMSLVRHLYFNWRKLQALHCPQNQAAKNPPNLRDG